jgi:hypothetical protein
MNTSRSDDDLVYCVYKRLLPDCVRAEQQVVRDLNKFKRCREFVRCRLAVMKRSVIRVCYCFEDAC